MTVSSSTYTTVPWLETSDTTTATTASSTVDKTSLGKDDFLKLLITQLKYQDPMSPMDDKEFIAQMASFSSLEQMSNLNTTMTNLSSEITGTLIPKLMIQQAGSMIGQQVSYTNSDAETVQGTVASVVIKDGIPYYVVDGKEVALDSITAVSAGTTQTDDVLSQLLESIDTLNSLLSFEEGETVD